MNDERVVLHQQGADDDLRRADQLADADHGGVGENRCRRHLQAFEGLLPLRARDRTGAERVQVVRQQDGGGLRQPEQGRIARDVLERHHENARSRVRRRLQRARSARFNLRLNL